MDLEAVLRDRKRLVDSELEHFFAAKLEEARATSPYAERLNQDLAEYTLRGGKRFRAALVQYGYQLFGGTDDKAITLLSLFMELLQSFLLVHDDIIDRSALRRGGPTVHKTYEKLSAERSFKDDVHFGESLAIISGDIANQYALELIADSPFGGKDDLLRLVSREITRVCVGQAEDFDLGYRSFGSFDKAEVLRVYELKTSTYTFKLPLLAGALLAGASAEDLATLEAYAMPCGIAFQIRDDIIGVFGESAETGKNTYDDLVEGKKTLLMAEAYAAATPDQQDYLRTRLGKQDLLAEEAEKLRDVVRNTGALERAAATAAKKVAEAKEQLAKLRQPEADAYAVLDGLADYLLIRTA